MAVSERESPEFVHGALDNGETKAFAGADSILGVGEFGEAVVVHWDGAGAGEAAVVLIFLAVEVSGDVEVDAVMLCAVFLVV